MTVSARQGDNAGILLQANITSLTTQINATASAQHKYAMQQQLDQLQREAVAHFMDVGRIQAATILSTLS